MFKNSKNQNLNKYVGLSTLDESLYMMYYRIILSVVENTEHNNNNNNKQEYNIIIGT